MVAFVDDEEADVGDGEGAHRKEVEEALRRADEDVRRGFEERREVLLEVSLAYAQTRADPEGATESDGEALGLGGLVDGGGDDEDLDAFWGGGAAFGCGLRCGRADHLYRRDDVRLDALLDRGRLSDNVLGAKDAGDRLGLDLGRRSEPMESKEDRQHPPPHLPIPSPLTHTWR